MLVDSYDTGGKHVRHREIYASESNKRHIFCSLSMVALFCLSRSILVVHPLSFLKVLQLFFFIYIKEVEL